MKISVVHTRFGEFGNNKKLVGQGLAPAVDTARCAFKKVYKHKKCIEYEQTVKYCEKIKLSLDKI